MSKPNTDGKKTDRGAGGRFTKGNKASPGRTPGRGKVAELRDKLAQDVEAVIGIVRDQALAGDPQAIRILLDRVLPSLRPVELPTPVCLAGDTLSSKAAAVLDAVAAGELACGQAAQLVGALGTMAKIVETDDLAQRVRILEDRHATKP